MFWNNLFKRKDRYVYNAYFNQYDTEIKHKLPSDRVKDYFGKRSINYWYVIPIEKKLNLVKDCICVVNIDEPKDNEHNWQVGEVLYFYPEYRWIKGCYYLFKNSENKLRISKCISVDKLGTFPPIFDGSETPGIGYECLGILIGKL